MTPPLATIVMPARNAATTIARATRSAAAQNVSVVLVDDASDDDTVARARAVLPSIAIVRPERRHTRGLVRQAGIQAVTTPYTVWLDADAELLPGRVTRLLDVLQREERTDIVIDGVEVVDTAGGETQHLAGAPPFVRRAPVRLFERMYLPEPGAMAVRTALARRLGYDVELHGAEQADFLLRALAAHARVAVLDDPGYRVHRSAADTSSRSAAQRQMYRRLLRKHRYTNVQCLYDTAGLSETVVCWGLVSFALFREEYETALDYIARAEHSYPDQDAVLEPDGPCQVSERWRVAFHRGTTWLLLGEWLEARMWLERADLLQRTAETLNNLGVALARTGELARARRCFTRALERFPDYVDARANAGATEPSHITSHLLRTRAPRQAYAPAGAR